MIAIFTKLLAISIVASNCFGWLNKVSILVLVGDSSSSSILTLEGLKEKNATSEADIKPEHIISKINKIKFINSVISNSIAR
jgi:hypothetical protein